MPPNYMMAGGVPPQFQANAANMAQQQQQMMQRMHQPQQNPQAMGMSTPQRTFSGPQGTPNNQMPGQPGQFPNQQGTPQNQTPNNPQQPPTVATPQTPTFPSAANPANVNGATPTPTPLSPGTESKEKERFALLLDINQELLYESIQLTNTKAELKKEQSTGEGQDGDNSEEKLILQDYTQYVTLGPLSRAVFITFPFSLT
jgi:hypothetical protein